MLSKRSSKQFWNCYFETIKLGGSMKCSFYEDSEMIPIFQNKYLSDTNIFIFHVILHTIILAGLE